MDCRTTSNLELNMTLFGPLPEHSNEIYDGKPYKDQLHDVEHKLYHNLELTAEDRELLLRCIAHRPRPRPGIKYRDLLNPRGW